MINNGLVSDIQHSFTYIYVYIYIHIYTHRYRHTYMYLFFFKFFSDLDYYKILSRVPVLYIRSLLLICIKYSCVHVNPKLLLFSILLYFPNFL